MRKKMKLPSLFKATESSANSWQYWPSCAYPKTLSFRAPGGDNIFKTINSAYIVDAATDMTEERCFATSEPGSFSNEEAPGGGTVDQSVEAVIRGLRSAERLFFDPGETILEANSRISVCGVTGVDHGDACGPRIQLRDRVLTDSAVEGRVCSFLMSEAAAEEAEEMPFEESEVVEVESRDPHVDFRRSMEEMVVAHGLKEWDCLEELLSWYLRVNGKKNHGYIVGAFVDLVVGSPCANLEDQPSSSSSSSTVSAQSPTCPLSFSSSSCTYSTSHYLSSLEAEDEIQKTIMDTGSS